MQYTTDRKWIGGGKAQTIAADAKDASPISAVAFALNETQYVSIIEQSCRAPELASSPLSSNILTLNSSISSTLIRITLSSNWSSPTQAISGSQDHSATSTSKPSTHRLLACKLATRETFTVITTIQSFPHLQVSIIQSNSRDKQAW